jgi:hypothetical protein
MSPMRLLAGPVAIVIIMCAWDMYSNHGTFTHKIVAGASDIARRAF